MRMKYSWRGDSHNKGRFGAGETNMQCGVVPRNSSEGGRSSTTPQAIA